MFFCYGVDYEMRFDVKEYSGELFVAVHDYCSNTIEFLESGVVDVNLKTDSLSAVEISPDNIVIIYDYYSSGAGLYNSKTNELRYKSVDISSGISFAN